MDPACLRHTELPHTSKLFSDFLYHYHRVERFYTAPPSTGYPEERRAALVEALRQQNGDSAALEKLAQPGAVTVVTGQQVGLFSGPAYTIYKALTAARLAADLTSYGRPAVPVFWLATEDHDFAEVNHCWSFDAANMPVKLAVNGNDGGVPVGEIPIERWPVDELRRSLMDFPYGSDVCDLVEQSYTPGRTMGQAFRALLQRLIEPYGFLFIDPMHPSTRALGAPMMRRAFTIGSDLNALLLQRNRELEAAGYHAQVHVEPRTSLFFLIENGRRVALRDVKYSPEQLAERAHDLSPNALLRPVVQDYMLPTAAYIGGPAELSYFAQSQVLYERLLGHMPRLVSRNGFTLIDTRSAKLLHRHKLQLRDFFHGEEQLRERIASSLVPADLQQQFGEAAMAISGTLDRWQRTLAEYDPTLAAAVDKSRAKMLHQLTKTRAKVAREMLRRDERNRAEASYLYHGLFPEKHLQERFYSILPFLARHGLNLMDRLYDNIRMDCPDHVLLPL